MLRSLMLILLSRTCAAFLTLSALAPGPLLDRAVTEVCFRYTCYREGLGSPLRLGKDVELTPIPRKGQGLVALRELPKGTLIGRYDGIVMEEDEWLASGTSQDYAMALMNGKVIEGEDPATSNWLRYINHSKRRANCKHWSLWDEPCPISAVFIETSRDIQPGEELLFNYGTDYWDERVGRWSLTRFQIDNL